MEDHIKSISEKLGWIVFFLFFLTLNSCPINQDREIKRIAYVLEELAREEIQK
jgi:hypothetical protein